MKKRFNPLAPAFVVAAIIIVVSFLVLFRFRVAGDALAYFGSVVGALATILAVALTIHFESDEREEQGRISMLPSIAASLPEDTSSSDGEQRGCLVFLSADGKVLYREGVEDETQLSSRSSCFDVLLRSVGNGPAVNVHVRLAGKGVVSTYVAGMPVHSPTFQFPVGDGYRVRLCFESVEDALDMETSLVLSYQDICGRCYEQSHSVMRRGVKEGTVAQFAVKAHQELVSVPKSAARSLRGGGDDALYEFSSEEGFNYVMAPSDLRRLFALFVIELFVGAGLTGAYLIGFLGASWEGELLLVLSAPSLCGCSVYYIRRLSQLGFKYEKRRLESGDYDCIWMRRWGAVTFFVSRALVVPVASFFALVLIRYGLLSSFASPVSFREPSEMVMLGISFLLGLSGGMIAYRLIDFGQSIARRVGE